MSLLDNAEELTAEELAYKGLEALPAKYQKTVGFFAWDFFVAIGKVIYSYWDRIVYICKCLTDLSNMTYEDLVNFVYQTRGITAKVPTASTGYITVTTGTGTISVGDNFSTADGTYFEAIETVDCVAGSKILVQCTQTGSIGNVPAGSITVIPTTIQGIVSVVNEEAFTSGYDKETKEALLERYYEDIRNSIISGNKYHYRKWALECSGVAEAIVKPLWNGENTVKVIILDSNNIVADSTLIETVQNYIDPKGENNSTWGTGEGQAPIGAYCTVTSGTPKNLDISVSIKLLQGYNLAEVTENIREKLNSFLKSIAFKSTVVSYSQISSYILQADGVEDHTNLTVNGNTQSITLINSDSDIEVAVLDNLEVLNNG